jgi:ATP-dependent 26S proteasome regulatory subunit
MKTTIPVMINELKNKRDTVEQISKKKNVKSSKESYPVVNASLINAHIKWLESVITQRTTMKVDGGLLLAKQIEKIEIQNDPLSSLIEKFNLGLAERLVLTLCIVSNIKPELLDQFLIVNPNTEKRYKEYGGIINRNSLRFQPTLRTAIFLLSGNDTEQFLNYQTILRSGNVLFREQIVNLHSTDDNQDYLPDCIIQLDSAYVDYLFSGETPRLDSGNDFPAKLLETDKTFKDLVLKKGAFDQLKPAINYVKVQQELYSNSSIQSKIKKGFVLLLHGPPGTGKTLTASILGNELNTPAYQIDSSQVVSKYIGETEKNLERVFNRLEGKNCILFFDEADSLFGKRTEISDSKDRYANQGVSYLLQRIESFDGLVILATNYEKNFDDAFKRRILSKVHIGRPSAEERELLWERALPEGYKFSSENLLNALAKHFDFTGANISVVIKMSVERSFSENSKEISLELMAPFLEIVGREITGVGYRPLSASQF